MNNLYFFLQRFLEYNSISEKTFFFLFTLSSIYDYYKTTRFRQVNFFVNVPIKNVYIKEKLNRPRHRNKETMYAVSNAKNSLKGFNCEANINESILINVKRYFSCNKITVMGNSVFAGRLISIIFRILLHS